MKLFQYPYSHNCAKVKIALLEKGLAFEAPATPPGFTRSPEFLAMNPLGLFPFLVDGDVRLGESEVIVEYLEERYPTPALLPPTVEGRARSRWYSRFHDMYLGPQLSKLFFALNDGRKGTAAFEPEIDRLFELVAILESVIDPQPFLMGEQFTLADAPYALSYHFVLMLTAAHGRPLTETDMPKLTRWYAAASQRPSVAQVMTAAKAALGGG
ncbi:MAG: glutathione S-transferase family protein [Myxococcota bacterium]